MSKHSTIRKVIAASAISGVLALTALSGGSASADGGTHEVGHWMGLWPAAHAPLHKATDVTLKRGVIGDGTSTTVMLAEGTPSSSYIARYHLTDAWPQK